MEYRNTQIGTAMLSIFGIIFLILIFASISKPNESIAFAYIVVGLAAILFSTLTIRVKEGRVNWFFGPKFWNKTLNISQIESAKEISTRWYCGFGIRLVSTGWLYNVSGLTAVELKLKDGTTVSLGTNDPDNLIKAIEQSS